MSIEEQIDRALAEGRAINANSTNIYFFLLHARIRAISADIRTIADAIINGPNSDLPFAGYDLACAAVAANDGFIKNRALEVIYQVHATCEI